MFRKCLFQVINTKKYYYHNLWKKAIEINAKKDVIEELYRKMIEEKDENEIVYKRSKGTNVIYG